MLHQGQSKTLRQKLICLFKDYFTDHLGNSLILTGKVPLSTPSTQEKKIFQSV